MFVYVTVIFCTQGGVVFNPDNRRILLIREKGSDSVWKFPGGLLDLGEEIADGVQREVREETGIASQFVSVLAIRHAHNIQFGRSDFYWICKLKALTEDIVVDDEIQDACWMAVDDFRTINKHPMHEKVLDILSKSDISDGSNGGSNGGVVSSEICEVEMVSVIRGRKNFKLYY